jgi:hypothetical protein
MHEHASNGPQGAFWFTSSRRVSLIAAFLFGLALASASVAHAQEEDAVEDRYQTWLALFAHGPLYQELWLWVDVQPRFFEGFEPAAALVRPGLSWHAMAPLWLSAGYAWTPSWRQPPEPRSWGQLLFTDEHRIWEQALLVLTHEPSGIAGQIRVRAEQRFRSGDVGFRLRVFLRLSVPLVQDRSLYFVLWDEFFTPLNDTNWGQRAGFDQNRVFVGLGWQAVPGMLRLEFGAASQWIVREGRDTANTIAAINAFVTWR